MTGFLTEVKSFQNDCYIGGAENADFGPDVIFGGRDMDVGVGIKGKVYTS